MKKILLVLVLATMIFSCKPYKKDIYSEIAPNETAFVIPLEKDTKEAQSKMKSEEYLESNKVAAKRIYIPTQWYQTGRMWFSGEYIPSVRVIKVDRAPVTREWTAGNGSGNTGTSNKKEDIEVESMESIGFGIGITATASIPEEWASRFLYNYNGRTLAQVMDSDVRAYIQNILTSEFGSRDLSDCQGQRKVVFETMRTATTEYFADMGVKLLNIGAAGGFEYLDNKIQIAINDKFASEMKIVSAQNEVDSAKKFALAKNSIEDQKMLDARIELIKSIGDGLKSGNLKLPTTWATDSSMMDLFAMKNLNK